MSLPHIWTLQRAWHVLRLTTTVPDGHYHNHRRPPASHVSELEGSSHQGSQQLNQLNIDTVVEL
jgi:hypothetical protein